MAGQAVTLNRFYLMDEEGKTQIVRLIDVFLLGPLMI